MTGMQEIPAATLQKLLSETPPVLLDVREEWELEQARLPGTLHIPMAQIPSRFRELDAAAHIVVVCHHGMRSQQVVQFLKNKGFARVDNLAGGLDAWAEQVDPSMPRY